MEGSTVLAAGCAVRVRPLDGGGNESQLNSPSAGVLSVHGLAPGNYEAVDELGNRRVFTVTSASDVIVLEDYGQGPDVPEGAPLDPLHGTEAPLVADQSHEIQAGQPAMTIEGGTLVRGELDESLETAPPTIPGPNPPAVEPPVAPSAVVTDETVGNSSDAGEATKEGALSAEEVAAQPTPPAADVLDAKGLAAVVAGADDAPAGVEPVAARDELERRAKDGDPDAEQALAALEVPPADDPEHEPVNLDVDPGAQA